MKKQVDSVELVTLTVRVTRETAAALKRVADREYRPVAAEMRRLIEERVSEEPPNLKEAA
jgi:hypothetical protein